MYKGYAFACVLMHTCVCVCVDIRWTTIIQNKATYSNIEKIKFFKSKLCTVKQVLSNISIDTK